MKGNLLKCRISLVVNVWPTVQLFCGFLIAYLEVVIADVKFLTILTCTWMHHEYRYIMNTSRKCITQQASTCLKICIRLWLQKALVKWNIELQYLSSEYARLSEEPTEVVFLTFTKLSACTRSAFVMKFLSRSTDLSHLIASSSNIWRASHNGNRRIRFAQ